MNIEQFAIDLFVNYAYKETGKRVNWHYLSETRKLAWIKEVSDLSIMIIDQIQPKLDLKVNGLGASTSYEKAWLSGESFENFRCKSLINSLKSDILDQYQDYEESVDVNK